MIYDKKRGINTHLRGILLDLDTGLLIRYPSFFDTETGRWRRLRMRPGQTEKILENDHVPTVRDLEEVEGRGRIQFVALPPEVRTERVIDLNPQLLAPETVLLKG